MNLCMYVHVCTYVRTYVHTYVRTYVRTPVYIHTYIHTCIHVCIWYAFMYVRVRMYIHMNLCMYVHTYVRTPVYIRTYIRVHTYILCVYVGTYVRVLCAQSANLQALHFLLVIEILDLLNSVWLQKQTLQSRVLLQTLNPRETCKVAWKHSGQWGMLNVPQWDSQNSGLLPF